MNRSLEIRIREQRNFEEWITRDTCLGWKSLDGIRDENGLMNYDDIDIKISGPAGLRRVLVNIHGSVVNDPL